MSIWPPAGLMKKVDFWSPRVVIIRIMAGIVDGLVQQRLSARSRQRLSQALSGQQINTIREGTEE